MATSDCYLIEVVVRLQNLLVFFILPVWKLVAWCLVGGLLGTACVGLHSFETEFQPFRVVSSSPFGMVPPKPMDPICEALIDNFTESSVHYTRCIIQNAKTYKRCQRCINEYLQVDKTYHLLTQEQNNSMPKRCTEIYPGMEDVNVFSIVHYFVENSWKAGGCQNCFLWFDINSGNAGKLTTAAETFLNMSQDFLICIFNDSIVYNSQEAELSHLLLHHSKNDSNMTICTRCKKAYKRLNVFYVHNFETMFEKDAIICADIADLMNFTRYMWHDLYNCPIHHASVWPVIVASVVMSSLPVGYYIATKIFGHDVERTLVRQKRLRRRSGTSPAVRISTSSDIGNHLPM